jgi:hypothetical protein
MATAPQPPQALCMHNAAELCMHNGCSSAAGRGGPGPAVSSPAEFLADGIAP